MATPIELKKRITAIDSIRKITKAMELVSTSKLRHIKKQYDMTRDYYETTYNTLEKIFSKISETELKNLNIPIFKKSLNKILYILINSDLGFCGGYNNNCNKFLSQKINKKTDLVYCIGKKAVSFCKNNNLKIYGSSINITDDIASSIIRSITNQLITGFQSNEFDTIKIVYTKFINFVTFEPNCIDILPINKEKLLEQKKSVKGIEAIYTFEPDVVSVITSSIPIYLGAVIFGSLIESKVSEQAARKNSMENATNNADDINEALNIQYNRLRQSKITTEITEIVSANK